MAQDTQTIINQNISSVKELREEVSRLRDALVTTSEGTEEWVSTTKQLNAAQEKLSSVMNAGKTSIEAASDSIVGMEREYKNLYNTYKLLSEEQRNSDFGKGMAESLNTLSEKLNNTKKNVGNFKDNIGHYTQSAMDAFSQMGISVGALQKPMKLATAASKGLGASLKTLIANPVGAIVMAIVLAFKALGAIVDKVKEAINNNEESQMRLKEAMSAFKPIIDGVKNAFDGVAKAVVGVIEWVSKSFETIRKAKAAFTDFIGITKGAKEEVEAQIKLYNELAAAQNELTKKTREYKELNANDKATVERLREEASEMENGADKLNLLNEAKAVQAGIDAREIELAKDRLKQLEAEASLTANDAEMNDKLAEAKAKVAEVEAQASANARNFNKQINTVNKTIASAAESARKEAQKILDAIEENNKSEIQKLTDKYEKEKAMLKQQHLDTKALTKQYHKDLAKLEAQAEADRISAIASYNQRVIALQGDNALKQVDTQIRDAEKMKALFESKFGEDTKKAINGKSKEEVINMAKSIGIDIPDDADKKEIGRLIELSRKELEKKIEDLGKSKAEIVGEGTFKYLQDYAKAQARDTAKAISEIGDDEVASETERQKKISAIKARNLAEYIGELDAQLVDFKGTEEQKLELEMEYYEKVEELRQIDYNNAKEVAEYQKELDESLRESKWAMANGIMDSISSISNSISALRKEEIEEGELSKKETEKKKKALKTLEAIQVSVAVAKIAADTAQGIMGVWSAYGQEKIANAETALATGPAAAATLAALNAKSLASAILNTTTLAAAGAANITAAITGSISNFKAFEKMGNDSSSSNGAVTSSTTQMSESNPYTYTRNVQTNDEQDQMNQPIWVSVQDISSAQSKVTVRDQESTF